MEALVNDVFRDRYPRKKAKIEQVQTNWDVEAEIELN